MGIMNCGTFKVLLSIHNENVKSLLSYLTSLKKLASNQISSLLWKNVTNGHRYLSNINSVLLWNLVTTFVKKSAPKFSVWPQLFKFLYQFTFWIVLIFLIFFLFLSPNLIFAFWNATWWHFKIFHKNLNLRFLFNNLSHWWKSKQFAPKF